MLYIATALHVEAKPLIKHYRLKRDMGESRFQIFGNDDIKLVVTGTGKVNSAIGVAHVLATNPVQEVDYIVNIGVCGSLCSDRGTIYIVNKIRDHDTLRDFYPDILLKHPFDEASIEAFSHPLRDSSELSEELWDMESSGFFMAASRYADVHRVWLIKIAAGRLDGILDEESIESLVGEKMVDIAAFLSRLKDTSIVKPILSGDEIQTIEDIAVNIRLTESQKAQLLKACMGYKSRTGKDIDFLREYTNLKVMTKDERKRVFHSLLTKLGSF